MHTNNVYHSIIDDLVTQGWAIVNPLLAKPHIETLRQEILAAYDANELNKAKLGQAGLKLESVRGDLIQWIDPALNHSTAMTDYNDFLVELQLYLNRELQLGIKDYELHYTLYPKNSRYQRHIDKFAHKKTRQISFILYLNQAWQTSDGGLLKLYDKNSLAELSTVLPEENLFICFLSDLPHEVTLTQRERISITGWFKGY